MCIQPLNNLPDYYYTFLDKNKDKIFHKQRINDTHFPYDNANISYFLKDSNGRVNSSDKKSWKLKEIIEYVYFYDIKQTYS